MIWGLRAFEVTQPTSLPYSWYLVHHTCDPSPGMRCNPALLEFSDGGYTYTDGGDQSKDVLIRWSLCREGTPGSTMRWECGVCPP